MANQHVTVRPTVPENSKGGKNEMLDRNPGKAGGKSKV